MKSSYKYRFRIAMFISISLNLLNLAGYFLPLFFKYQGNNKPRITINLPLLTPNEIQLTENPANVRRAMPDEILIKFRQETQGISGGMENNDSRGLHDEPDDKIEQNQIAENVMNAEASTENIDERENPVPGSEITDIQDFVSEAGIAGDEDSFASTESYDRYYQLISRKIGENMMYPASARRRGIQGKVIVQCKIDREGNCAEIKTIQSSGHAILDKAALESIGRVFPCAHDSGHVFRMIIPISFILDE